MERMDIYERKAFFVRTSLRELLQDANGSVLDVYYVHRDGEEWVTIRYMLNDFKRCVRVTGDSLLGIAKDVLKAL